MELLRQLFYRPSEGLVNENKLAQKAKDKNIDVSRKEIHEFYKDQEVNQLMKPRRKPKEFSSIVGYYPNHTYQMDIIVYDRYEMNHYKYILVVIDVYSRYMMARPLTNRRFETIMDNIKTIFKTMGLPEEMNCDNEFNTHEFNNYCQENDIDVRYSDPNEINKNAIVERVNGTIATQLQKIRITTKRHDWYKYLEFVVENYNSTIHSTIKEKPIDVFKGLKTNRQKLKYVKPSFEVGDKVRIITKKKEFEKGDVIKSSKEVYLIESISGQKYKLEGVQRLFKPYEIKKIGEIVYKEDSDVEYDILPDEKPTKRKVTFV